MLFLRLCLFGISTLGTFELIRKACNGKVGIYFLPSLTIAIQLTVLFLAGILNLLPEMTTSLYIIGFVGIIYSLYREKGISFLKSYINIGYAVLLVLLMIFTVYLKGKMFSGYDNFSHWALVVKRMIATNRYPNFKDAVIFYQEYPLGSSTYIYYWARLIGTNESVQMLAQCYMMLAAMLPLYSFAKNNQLAVSVVIVSFVNYVLLYNIKITDLLVDTLLPLVGMCGLLFAYWHCKEGGRTPYYLSAFYMVELIQIKNSGVFFAGLMAISLIVYAWKQKEHLRGLVCAVLPFISLMLWQKHCDYVYDSAVWSTHSMTVKNYASVFGNKTRNDILSISSSLLRFAVSYKEIWITVGIAALIGLLILLERKDLKKSFLKVAVYSFVLYVVYQLGMLAMYLFSMPLGEAIILASVDRYTKTILTAILYLNMILAVKLISELSGKKMMTAITTICTFASFFAGMYISSGAVKTVVQEKVDATKRKQIEEWVGGARAKYGVPSNESYCILSPSSDDGYTFFLGRYIFMEEKVTARVIENEEELDNLWEKYIFVYDRDNEVINNWIQKKYPEQVGNEVIFRETD